MLLPGRYKGNRKRRVYRPRTLEEIMGEQFKIPHELLDFGKIGGKSKEQRMARSDYFQGGNFLKAADFTKGQIVIVESFEAIKTRIGTRPILRLKNFDRPFGLNATNYDFMVEKFGEDESKWAGKRARIGIVQAPNPSNGGKMQAAVRLE